ncbi:Gfo/Idh/MocA family protein [Brevifollis gellanilyticus]|uniref:Dehydrogenase n=1 Tax=Brevifollis gellanilyticus TaxID=748831 RepID=A0A512M7Z8_9BACT|nr:Gfo/Idh/MocA family oxidoreductase [Brevifollis gellanilyticus]GEP42845.1 dehydrogenase [Brevifollis gellanilyticus]
MSSILNRRQFVHSTAILTAATSLRAQQKADSNETLRIGLVGCGGRGTGAANQALGAEYNGKIVAMADVDMKQIDASIASLTQKFPDRVDVKADKKFIGLDAYKQLIDSGVDVVLLASPPGFRPMHLQAAVEAGKHIFCEKPMAVDSVGYHVAMAAVNKAKEKKLNLVAGFCWRYSTSRLEAFKRALGGDIGKITSVYATYHTGPVKPMPPASGRPEGMSDVEWQVRNWYNFSWLSGDSLVEQAVHSVDKICWAMGDKPPMSCIGTGGRQIKAEDGNIFDHFHAAYEWDNGLICNMASRQIKGCQGHNQDVIRGEKGTLVIGKGGVPFIDGEKRWRFRGDEKNMYDLEHEALFNAIRKGEVINDGDRMMLSTMVGIMGREAAYTGQLITWDQMLACTQDLAPDTLKWGDSFKPTPMPQPGVTKFELPEEKKGGSEPKKEKA